MASAGESTLRVPPGFSLVGSISLPERKAYQTLACVAVGHSDQHDAYIEELQPKTWLEDVEVKERSNSNSKDPSLAYSDGEVMFK
ncbi:hypothetical protein LIER_13736 [Lithospermum erythrorhizon]|uniref:Uncharacterized protein n=1 Tax=Lithospermum erythrorhizon TaxID=34254 RepID=A0AAV3PWH6_LITER